MSHISYSANARNSDHASRVRSILGDLPQAKPVKSFNVWPVAGFVFALVFAVSAIIIF